MPILTAEKMIVDLPFRSRRFRPNPSIPGRQNIPPQTTESEGRGSLQVSEAVDIQIVDSTVWIRLEPTMAFDKALQCLRRALRYSPEEIFHKVARLDLGDRMPDKIHCRNASRILMEERKLTLVGIRCTQEAMRRFSSREHRLSVEIQTAPESTKGPRVAETLKPDTSRPTIVNKTIRSGKSIRVVGDLIVFGDVNPGARIECTGSVAVFGVIRGSVHAGCSGDASAQIVAVRLKPNQLRIADKIADAEDIRNCPRRFSPVVAHVIDDSIVLDKRATLKTSFGESK